MAENVKGLKDFERDLEAFCTPAKIAQRFIDLHGDRVIEAVITSAKAGLGPGKPFPPHADSTAKGLGLHAKTGGKASWTRSGGKKNFLVQSGVMLDDKRFTWRIDRDGITLVWDSGGDAKLGTYAEVHNDGLPIGRGGPVKQREFMHFECTISWAAVEIGLGAAIEDLKGQFEAGRVR